MMYTEKLPVCWLVRVDCGDTNSLNPMLSGWLMFFLFCWMQRPRTMFFLYQPKIYQQKVCWYSLALIAEPLCVWRVSLKATFIAYLPNSAAKTNGEPESIMSVMKYISTICAGWGEYTRWIRARHGSKCSGVGEEGKKLREYKRGDDLIMSHHFVTLARHLAVKKSLPCRKFENITVVSLTMARTSWAPVLGASLNE